MATAVSYQGGQFKSWASLPSDIDGNDAFPNTDESSPDSLHKQWSNRPLTPLKDGSPPPKQDHLILTIPNPLNIQSRCLSCSAINLTPDQYLEFHKFLNLLRTNLRRTKNGNIGNDYQKPSLELTSLLDPVDSSELLENYDSLLTSSKLLKALFDANIDQIATEFRNNLLANRCKRRHCNSESDINWCGFTDNRPKFGISKTTSEYITVRNAENENSGLRESDKHTDTGDSLPMPQTPISYQDVYNSEYNTDNDNFSSSTVVVSYTGEEEHVELSTQVDKSVNSDFDEVCPNLHEAISEVLLVTNHKHGLTSNLSTASSCSKLAKSVSFADEIGLPLTEVYDIEQTETAKNSDFEDDLSCATWSFGRTSRIPKSGFRNHQLFRSGSKQQTCLLSSNIMFSDQINHRRASTSGSSLSSAQSTDNGRKHKWTLDFPQPAAKYYEFRQRVENGAVSLENISLSQPDSNPTIQYPRISGTVKVKNLSYEKQVWLRVTTDNWQSYADHMAIYDYGLSTGYAHSAARFDTFKFRVDIAPQLEPAQQTDRIEFAIRFLSGPDGSWGQYWDNNNGKNYVIERRTFWLNSQLDSSTDLSSVDYNSTSGVQNHPSTPIRPYTSDYRPNFEGISQFTDYRSWTHFAGETTYY